MISLGKRLEALQKLHTNLQKYENDICNVLHQDLGKSYFESQITELDPVYDELKLFKKNLHSWTQPQRVSTPLKLFTASSYMYPQAYGNVLIISPWNFPFNLTLLPLIGAIGAGNTVVIKPSEFSPYSSRLLETIINESFDSEHVQVIQGDATVGQSLLHKKWDYIFFTGSTAVGKIVMHSAAENLTPLTLELGGMNPCIVDETANLHVAAQRIIWGKFINTGQNCLSINCVYVEQSVRSKFIQHCVDALNSLYGSNPERNPEYGRIINQKHMERLTNLLHNAPIIYGGNSIKEQKYIQPTLIDELNPNHPLLHEEIFGPLLPIQSYQNIETLVATLQQQPKPLALYLFSSNKKTQRMIANNTFSGGLCINDVLLHEANSNLPFGGVGFSGFGSYHGKKSFDTFTHYKSVLHNRWRPELTLRYGPWRWGHALLRKFF
jgi:acyl-CoA reductase-like NAD-dependent aldehyde dehydrogenase